MKKVLSFILITAFLFPSMGQAASAPATTQSTGVQTSAVDPLDINNPILQGKSLAAKKKVVQTGLNDIFNRLTDLAAQTQIAINQLNTSGTATDEAQKAIIAANASLAKAKIDIDAFSGITVSATKSGPLTLSTLKYTANTAENTLNEAKKHLIESLNSLKASLPDSSL